MSSPEFTNEGVTVRTFDEIFASIAEMMRGIYGENINLDQDTPDGQFLGIISKQILDLETFGFNLYAQLDPDFSVGEIQNKIIKICGINRRPGTQSVVDVQIVVEYDLTLEAGYTAADDSDQNWVTTEDLSLLAGSNTITMYAEEYGSVSAGAATITSPVTIVIGVTSVNNALAASPGVDEETDEELRIRRNKSLENAAYSTVGGLLAKLGEIENVTDAVVYENVTDATDSDGIPGHSIWAIVEGGDVANIAETMTKNKTAGTGMLGAVTGIYNETIMRANGDTFVIPHEMKFDRPDETDLYIKMTATRKTATNPVDIDLIKQNLVALDFGIGESVQANSLYSTVYQPGPNFVATLLEISLDGITYTDESIDITIDKKLVIDAANIDITEVV